MFEKEYGLENADEDVETGFDGETSFHSDDQDSDEFAEDENYKDVDEQVRCLRNKNHCLSQKNMHTFGAKSFEILHQQMEDMKSDISPQDGGSPSDAYLGVMARDTMGLVDYMAGASPIKS
ncbi:hypothetical protein KSS87_010141 [Heliosperma pusillum]|nr:hypothetical protein KSS87_010141 [Heliosperma pusillum]